MRTADQMQAQWESKFDEVRSPREWAEFCAGMSVKGLERAFAFAIEKAHREGAVEPRGSELSPQIAEARVKVCESHMFVENVQEESLW